MTEDNLLTTYSLPDAKLIYGDSIDPYTIWYPDREYVVLGRSNSIEEAVHINYAKMKKAVIMKRPSGGQTVVLTPLTIAFAIKLEWRDYKTPGEVFKKINSALIDQFKNGGVNNIVSKGISDLSINDKKILGSSMYLKDGYYYYHAVLNISESPDIISSYLKHPTREPDYRAGREHASFITSLWLEGYKLTNSEVYSIVETSIIELLKQKEANDNNLWPLYN